MLSSNAPSGDVPDGELRQAGGECVTENQVVHFRDSAGPERENGKVTYRLRLSDLEFLDGLAQEIHGIGVLG